MENPTTARSENLDFLPLCQNDPFGQLFSEICFISSSEKKQNWLVSRELLLNKLNKQSVYDIDSFNKLNFSHSQKILDTLIDVKNAKYQNTTS